MHLNIYIFGSIYLNKMRFLLLLAFLLPLNLYAQTDKGTTLVGGTGSLGFHEPLAINLNPTLGYFVLPKFALGGTLPFSYYYFKYNDTRNIQIGFIPFARYYFGNNDKNRFFAQAKSGLIYTSYYNLYPSGRELEYDRNFLIGLGAGYVRFITENVGLEAILGLNSNEDRRPEFNSNFHGVNLQLGIQFYLSKAASN